MCGDQTVKVSVDKRQQPPVVSGYVDVSSCASGGALLDVELEQQVIAWR